MKKLFIISILAIGCVNNLYAVESCGIDELDTSISAISYGQTRLDGTAGVNESNYGLTVGSGEWATEFSYGTVWGMANCNSTSGTKYIAGTPTLASSGTNCWCQVTGFSPSDSDYTQGPQCTTSASNMWVFYASYSNAATCAYACAYCGTAIRGTSTAAIKMRKALLDAVPRTFSLNWYDGDTPFSGGASSCTLGGTFTPPSTTPPAREGYIFTGWRILTCANKIERLDDSISSNQYGYISSTSNNNATKYGLTETGTWAVEFSYGVVYGNTLCSITSGSHPNTGTPSSTQGSECWYQATGFTANGNDYTSGAACKVTPKSTLWIYRTSYSGESDCMKYCTWRTVLGLSSEKVTRTALFGAVGQ